MPTYATISYTTQAIIYSDIADTANGVVGGLLGVSDIGYNINIDRTIENTAFSFSLDNTANQISVILAGVDKNIVGRPVLIQYSDSLFANRKTIGNGIIRSIQRSDSAAITFACDRNSLALADDLGTLISKTDFPLACEDALGQYMAFPVYGKISENTSLQKTENNTGQIKCWRIDTNIFLVGILGGASKTLELAYDKDFVDITATSTLGVGTYNSVDYDIITHTSTDAYIFCSLSCDANLVRAIRWYTKGGSYFFNNVEGTYYTIWNNLFINSGYVNSNIAILCQKEIKNIDHITSLCQTFDLWACPLLLEDINPYFYLHLEKNEYLITGDYAPDLTLNYSQIANYQNWIDFENVYDEIKRCYWYMWRNDFFNRLPSDTLLTSDWDATRGNCDLRYVYDDQIAQKLAMRHLFFNNKPKFYCSFDVPFSEANYIDTCGKLIKLNYPLGFFPNTDRILQIMRMTYSPDYATINFECLDRTFIVSKMKDIKLLIQSNTTDNNTTFYDFSPTGEHAITPVSNVIHDTAATKYGSTSIYYPGYVNPVMSYLSTPASADWEIFLQTNATVSFWVKFAVATGMQMIIFDYADSTNWWQIERLANNKVRFCGRNTAGYFLVLDSGTTIADTNWHHVACVKVGALHGIYIDGVQVAYVSMASSITIDGTLYIGHHPVAATVDLNGWLDEIMFSHDNFYGASPNVGLTNTITVPTKKLTWEG